MSTSIKKVDDDESQLEGDFTIEGTTIDTKLGKAFGGFYEISLR